MDKPKVELKRDNNIETGVETLEAHHTQKPWYMCSSEGCHYIKAGPRSQFCKQCLHKKHQIGQENSRLRIVIKLKKRVDND